MRIAMILTCALLMAVGCDDCNGVHEVTGFEKLHGGGAPSSVVDIAIIGDGYTESEQSEFDEHVQRMVAHLEAMEPFRSVACGYNVWKINLVSHDGSSALDVRFGDTGEPDRYIGGSTDKCFDVCRSKQVPGYDVIVVLVNSERYAAWTDLTNSISYLTDQYPWGSIMAHELGHAIAGLGDEYPCKVCAPGVLENPQYPAGLGEPLEPNLTTNLGNIPWGGMITAAQLPTLTTSVLDTCTMRSPVGAYEGGGYYAQGIYRPEQFCLMDRWVCEDENFCAVCEQVVKEALRSACE